MKKYTFRDYVELMTMTFLIIAAVGGVGYATLLEIGINALSIVFVTFYILLGLYGIVRLNQI
jgi:hypothetical protein